MSPVHVFPLPRLIIEESKRHLQKVGLIGLFLHIILNFVSETACRGPVVLWLR